MTEYLVVLGVTGAALLAATTDVSQLYENVRGSYANQSSEMNKVQRYDNQAFRYSEVVRPGEGDEEEEPGPPIEPEIPEQEYPPFVEDVYDADGNHIGIVKDGYLIDSRGEQVAICQRDNTGGCVFLDENGNVIDQLNGASLVTRWVDDQGNELVLQALSNGNQVMGFAYLYNNKYYDAASLKLIDPQPTGLSASATRKVQTYDSNGKAFLSGYEVNGLIYGLDEVLTPASRDYSRAMTIVGELVSVDFNGQQPDAAWQKYKPCLVRPHGWSNGIANNSVVTGPHAAAFTAPPAGTNYINTESASCNGRTQVTLHANGNWILTR
ncbi:hypothetical protein EGJ23_12985 [Pseudomonas sp. o96-267]|nr:hypothetical protein EGJ23_12985 [Pseudomonas sp. o96-267]